MSEIPPASTSPSATPIEAPQTVPVQDNAAPKQEHDTQPNALVNAFTAAEKTALSEFKSDFLSVTKRAFPDDDEKKSFKLWGIVINPLDLDHDSRIDVVLMKFLRARNLNAQAAQDMMIATLRWRQQFDIDKAMEENQENLVPDAFKRLGIIDGVDKEGRPIVYNLYGEANNNMQEVFADVQRFIRWRVALMERTVLMLDFHNVDQTVQIHDYAGVGLTSRDANSKNAAAEATNIFQNHYPEFLYKKLFVNVPTFMSWIFWAFTTFLSPKTVEKMTVIGPSKYKIKQALQEFLPDDRIPRRYDGGGSGF